MTSAMSGAAIYGFPTPQTAQAPPTSVASPSSTPVKTPANTPAGGWHQDPVLILVIMLGIAFLLARGAEHGLSFGFRVRAR
ncbi:MAG: hypothetical protein ACYCVN_12385 [Acidimicrobiales bacterium]